MLYVIEDIGGREYHEDRHCIEFNIYKDIHYFAVFDGHGNEKVAVFMKMFFKDILKIELGKSNRIPIEQCLYNAFLRLQTIIPKDIAINSGSTALVILKQGNTLYVANVGDSRAIMSSNKKAIPITEDHKPNKKEEYDRITQLGGFVIRDPYGTPRVNGTLALSRAIGDFYLSPYVSWVPDIYTVKLNPSNKYLVAASDGLWDVYDNQELVDYINSFVFNNSSSNTTQSKLYNTLCIDLLRRTRSKGSSDNVTIMLFVLD